MTSSAGSPPSLRLQLLGGATLTGPRGAVRLERKTAALLAVLAVEGPTPRARLAGLLWADSPETTARGNLRQALRRLKGLHEVEVLEGTDPLALAPGVATDVAALDVAAALSGPLLEGLAYDDTEELDTWVRAAREGLDARRAAAVGAEVDRRERAGALGPALELAQQALALDRLSEEAHRRVMRLHFASGDRGAAMAAFERCRTLLEQELGVVPLPETLALARDIAQASARPAAPPRAEPARRVPLSVLRPPVLAGREREWARMEEAWAAHKGIVLAGPPGVGKSRLMQDFLNAHARAMLMGARPGDRTVPYGTHARTFRQTLQVAASGGQSIPDWVRRELARIIPELGEAPPPFRGEEDKLRFFQAKVEALRLAYRAGYTALGFDDLQYVDDASAEAGAYSLHALRFDTETPFRTIHCYRAGELPPNVETVLRQAADAGLMLLIDLEPLSDADVGGLLQSLGVPGLEQVAGQVQRHAGGNPLFVLETVKSLLEQGALQGGGAGVEAALPREGAVRQLLEGRLARLSPGALHLARLVSVLGTQLTLERAVRTLEARPHEVAAWWGELEAAQVVRGSGFSHDLMGEAVAAGTPAPVRQMLHRQVAQVLETERAPAALVAAHWREGGEPARAAPRLREAAEAARAALLLQQAQGFDAQAEAALRGEGPLAH